MIQDKNYEVIIVGGSYAGLSAAMALGRSLRNVLIVDGDQPCNASTPHSHNFLTQDGRTPAEIARNARKQVESYSTITFRNDFAIEARKVDDSFMVKLQSGIGAHGKKLLFATGIKDQLLNIPGFSECWGISVIHCPYCHGYEYREKKTAVLANGEAAWHYAMLVGNLTNKLTIFTNGQPEFSDDQLRKISNHNFNIISTPVVAVEHEQGHLRNVVLKDGRSLPFDALYFKPPFQQHSTIPQAMGCEITEQGYIKIDQFQKTSLEGVYACGDNASPMRSVANAVATGNMAGAVINRELALENF